MGILDPKKKDEPKVDYGDLSPLKAIGIGEVLAGRIVEFFNFKPAGEIVRDLLMIDPYVLMDVDGISFTKADEIAKTFFGVTEHDHRRLSALILKIIDDNKNWGHTFLPITVLEKELKKYKLPLDIAKGLIDLQVEKGNIIIEDGNRIYLAKLYKYEVEVAAFLRRRVFTRWETGIEVPPELSEICDPCQLEALKIFSLNNIFVLTGGPGTGKTFTVKKFYELIEKEISEKTGEDAHIALCAPTGKAAKRLGELTGKPAKTIHRLLGAGYGKWEYNKYHLLTGYDWIIVDEASMLDLELAWRLLSAIPTKTNIIFVGDVDQLPPIGPGSFFRDLLKYHELAFVRLEINHRQGKGSLIAHNALQINRGGMKLIFGDDLQLHELNPIDIRSNITKYIDEFIAEGYDPIRDIQVLSPQKETVIGVKALNELLRYHLNPNATAMQKLSVGDKVMQTVNDYMLNVFNGYIGVIQAINPLDMEILFLDEEGERLVIYPRKFSENLMLAYAATIHKFQGSECKAGIVIVSTTHTFMLSRNLLYTGITRFKEKCYILGDLIGLRRAVTNTKENERWSRLLQRLEDS